VKQLHENAKISHKFSRDFTNHFRSGTINFDLGDNKSFSITVNADDTLEAIRRNINENNPFGLTASLVNSSSGYVLTLNHGQDFDISFGGELAEDFAQAEQTRTNAKKAIIEVNGNEIESDTNDFNQISGLEIHANFVSESHVQVRKDESGLDKDINDFVSKFNSMLSAIDSLGKRNTYTDGVSNNDGGSLAGNSSLRRMKDDLKNTIGNEYMDLGLEFDKNGQLTYKDKGLSFSEKREKLEEVLEKMKIKVDEYLGNDSFISKEKERLNNDISDANSRLQRNNIYIQKYQDTITKQYSKLDSMIQTANTQIQMINNLFGE
jgi:flagellar hook-associated protein 2